MSPQQPQPGTQVTGNEDQEFQAWLNQQIDTAVTAKLKGSGQQPTEAPVQAPITLNVNGQQATFQDVTQLQNFWNDYQNRVAATLNAQAQVPAQPAQGAEVTGSDAPKFTVDQFVEHMAKDPSEAIEAALRARGVDIEGLKGLQKRVAEQETVLAAAQFKEAFPDFPANNQSAAVLNQIREQYGLPWSVQGLTAAYAIGEKGHAFDAFRQSQVPQQFAPPQFTQPAPGYQPFAPGQFAPQNYGYGQPQVPVAPPRLGRSSAGPQAPDYMSMADDMTSEQIESIFDQLGGR